MRLYVLSSSTGPGVAKIVPSSVGAPTKCQ
jgi:hypothetical protein